MIKTEADPTLVVADRAVRIWLQYLKDASVRDDLLMNETWRFLDMDHRGSDLDALIDDVMRWIGEWSIVNAMLDEHSWSSFSDDHKAKLLNIGQQAHELIASQGLNRVEAFFVIASLVYNIAFALRHDVPAPLLVKCMMQFVLEGCDFMVGEGGN
jgi:hypothetical protein